MRKFKVTSTTIKGDVESAEIEAINPVAAAFLLGVEFGVHAQYEAPAVFTIGKVVHGDAVKASRSFVKSTGLSMSDMVVEEV